MTELLALKKMVRPVVYHSTERAARESRERTRPAAS